MENVRSREELLKEYLSSDKSYTDVINELADELIKCRKENSDLRGELKWLCDQDLAREV
jgi:hypothetical protein